MSEVQLISNTTKSNHKDYLLHCFANADEVFIATAFLKSSGLELLLPAIKKHINANKTIQIITGQNFGLTEPKALKTLHDIFEGKLKADLFLDKAEDKQKVFHPKLFLFRQGSNGIIVSGSANITSGGLINNEEFSVSVEVTISSPKWKAAQDYFAWITNSKNADLVSKVIINRYEQFYEEQKKTRQKQKVSPDKKSSEYGFDYSKLIKRLKEYRNKKYLDNLNERIKDYKEAKLLLDEIASSNNLPQKRFEEIIDDLVSKKGVYGLWRSGSLYRHRFDVYECKNEFRQLVKSIKENQHLAASKVFSEGKRLVKSVRGAAINYVAEIMMTYQPDRFANLNSNPINVLKKEAGVYFKSHSSSFNGEDYEEYCGVVLEICTKLKLENMLEADSFFNDIYWELKKEGKVK
jgi:HKD family nuclease